MTMARIYNNIIETNGNTPLVKLNRVTVGLPATVLLKCEFFSPLGSVKDHIGMSMIRDAEERGFITTNTTIIEPTSGNTGIALAVGLAGALLLTGCATSENSNDDLWNSNSSSHQHHH